MEDLEVIGPRSNKVEFHMHRAILEVGAVGQAECEHPANQCDHDRQAHTLPRYALRGSYARVLM